MSVNGRSVSICSKKTSLLFPSIWVIIGFALQSTSNESASSIMTLYMEIILLALRYFSFFSFFKQVLDIHVITRLRFLWFDLFAIQVLRDYIVKDAQDKKKIDLDVSEWSDYTPASAPVQQNGYDCGVFTCLFMEHLSRDAQFQFSQKNIKDARKRIAFEIMKIGLL